MTKDEEQIDARELAARFAKRAGEADELTAKIAGAESREEGRPGALSNRVADKLSKAREAAGLPSVDAEKFEEEIELRKARGMRAGDT